MEPKEQQFEASPPALPPHPLDAARSERHLTERFHIQGPILERVANAVGVRVDTRELAQDDDGDSAVLEHWLGQHGVYFADFVDILMDHQHTLFNICKEKERAFLANELTLEAFSAWLHRLQSTENGVVLSDVH